MLPCRWHGSTARVACGPWHTLERARASSYVALQGWFVTAILGLALQRGRRDPTSPSPFGRRDPRAECTLLSFNALMTNPSATVSVTLNALRGGRDTAAPPCGSAIEDATWKVFESVRSMEGVCVNTFRQIPVRQCHNVAGPALLLHCSAGI
jgi:hypothetical protein